MKYLFILLLAVQTGLLSKELKITSDTFSANEKKEIQGDEVVLQTTDGKAYAKGIVKKPVIMIFDISEEKDEEKQ
jgi:hypothetical protein